MSAIATKRDGKISFMNDENKVFRDEKCTFHSKNDVFRSIMTLFIARMTFNAAQKRLTWLK